MEKGLDIWSIYLNFHGRHAEITQLSSSSTFSEKKKSHHTSSGDQEFFCYDFFSVNSHDDA